MAERSVDERFVAEAIRLAAGGLERVSPNPLVGALVVRGGRVVGRGFHGRFGGPHAEVEALRDAGARARGATLYVSLEPCGHHGKTPPCADACVAAGLRRVVYAAADPNPDTRGRGPRILRAAGIDVTGGVLRRQAVAQNAPYFHWRRTGRPWVVLKWAMSLDGKIATVTGESQWITGRPARAAAHGLRRRVDAVLVGTSTALVDDPRLDPRPARGRFPLRLVLDRRARLPLSHRLLAADPRVAGRGPRALVTSGQSSAHRLSELRSRGVEVIRVAERGGRLDLEELLAMLGARAVSQLLVEGGGEVAGDLVARGLVDEVHVFVAPKVIGGTTAAGAVGGRGIPRLAAALEIEWEPPESVGRDWHLWGRVRTR